MKDLLRFKTPSFQTIDKNLALSNNILSKVVESEKIPPLIFDTYLKNPISELIAIYT